MPNSKNGNLTSYEVIFYGVSFLFSFIIIIIVNTIRFFKAFCDGACLLVIWTQNISIKHLIWMLGSQLEILIFSQDELNLFLLYHNKVPAFPQFAIENYQLTVLNSLSAS
jgi:hypothetical protein